MRCFKHFIKYLILVVIEWSCITELYQKSVIKCSYITELFQKLLSNATILPNYTRKCYQMQLYYRTIPAIVIKCSYVTELYQKVLAVEV